MTERKPFGTGFETWIDKQIREATERGDFEDLPGKGKPLPGSNEPYSEDWWLKDWLRRVGAPTDDLLPTPLQLRKEIGQLPDTVRKLRTEEKVRNAVADVNDRVRAWWRSSVGPQIHVGLVDVEQIVQQWRSEQPAPEPQLAKPPPPKKRWWRLRG